MDEGFRRVLATAEQRKEIAKHEKCSSMQVSRALRFVNNSLQSRKIRNYAVNILKCPLI